MFMSARLLKWAIVAFVTTFSFGVASEASAHTPSTFYTTGKWSNGNLIHFYVRSGFPSTAYTSGINYGANQWNAIFDGATPRFQNAGATTATGNFDSPCSSTFNGIYWRDIDYLSPAFVAYTRLCTSTSIGTSKFQMSIDAAGTPWYTGTAGTIGSSYVDLYSTTSHEFGHASSWVGHFSDSESICTPNSSQATMCPNIDDGTTWIRTLDTHSIHTFQAAYPW